MTNEQKIEHIAALRREADMAAVKGDHGVISEVHEQIAAHGGKVQQADKLTLTAAHELAKKRTAPAGEQR